MGDHGSAQGIDGRFVGKNRRAMTAETRARRKPIRIVVLAATLAAGISVAFNVARGGEADVSRLSSVDISRLSNEEVEALLASQAKTTPTDHRCLASLLTVEQAGLELRDQTEFRCPGIAAEPGDERHWGATCWQNELCPGGSWIAVDPEVIGPDDGRLRYVIAHEICHVNSYVTTGDRGTEPAADQCAAGAGFPRR